MTPYFESAGVAIYLGDFREVLPSLGVQADCIVADPPYGQTSLAWDRWPVGWPNALLPFLKDSGSMWCFGTLRMFMRQAAEFSAWAFAQDIIGGSDGTDDGQELVWHKHNGSSFHADRFKRVHEQAAQFYKADAAWADVFKSPVTTPDATARVVRTKRRPGHMGQIDKTPYQSEDGGPRLMRSVIYARSCHGSAVNETQKPLELVAPMLEYACPPGGLILEPFGGSAPAAQIAASTGRRAIVCEVREEQCEAAARRIVGGALFRTA